jgi:hypothetical protein
MADRMFPGRYQSNFAVQVTSQIPDAQKFTIKFANNNLLGSGNFLPAYTWSSGSTTPLLFLVGSVPLICSGTFWTGTAGGLGRLKAFGCFWLSPFEGEHMYGHRSEQYDLFELVRLERFARDQGDWSALVDSYWPTAVITTTWFRGSASDFAGESRKLYERGGRGKHTIDPVWARTQGDRALVESLGQILIRMPIAGVECDLTSWCRFFSRVRRGPHGWRLLSFDGIYVKDRLDPVLPNQPHPNLDWELLGRLRASYRFLSYLAHSQPGHSTDQELPGDDRPDLVQKFYREAEDWLSAVTQDATAS